MNEFCNPDMAGTIFSAGAEIFVNPPAVFGHLVLKVGLDDGAVLDARCGLHGLSGLYVADASVIPVLPSANTNLPTMMVAERVAHRLSAQG